MTTEEVLILEVVAKLIREAGRSLTSRHDALQAWKVLSPAIDLLDELLDRDAETPPTTPEA